MTSNPRLVFLFLLACNRGPVPILPSQNLGSCTYVNGFSRREECRDYLGDWSEGKARDDCKGWGGTLIVGGACDYENYLGYCVLGKGPEYARVTFPGNDTSKCGGSRTGCEVFGGGVFDPAPNCGGDDLEAGLDLPVFQQPILSCVDAKAGEPAGQSSGGQVCTWQMISGSTELGRDFRDYGACDSVRTQRPYHAAPTEENAGREDPRLNDAAYAAELDWFKQQVKASACVCCHSNTAPLGPANWYLESPNNLLNSFYGSGLAMGAGWINSVGFGTYPAEQNNGFSRPTEATPDASIFPTTDPERMKRIFESELAFRSLTRGDFADQPFAAGPLDEQRFYRPNVCIKGEGVDADGRFKWLGGGARYVYVLRADATSPTVPPNLDLPEGTLWRIDVSGDGAPIKARDLSYGVLPDGVKQRFPDTQSPDALQSGETYYLYVLADVAVPITRCLFVAP